MTEAGQRRRRLLLAGLGLGGVAMLATPAWLRRRIARHAGEDCANADWVFRNSESSREIGRRYLAEVPHEAELEALESALATSLGTDPVAVAEDAAPSAKIRRATELDFAAGRIVYLDGWMLSETEARLCAFRLLR